jgi:hypothetical protein
MKDIYKNKLKDLLQTNGLNDNKEMIMTLVSMNGVVLDYR